MYERYEDWEDDLVGNNSELRKNHDEWKSITDRVDTKPAALFTDPMECMDREVRARVMMEKEEYE